MRRPGPLLLRNARVREDGTWACRSVIVHGGRLVDGTSLAPEHEIDLGGRALLPALVNAHDHLDLSTFPALGRPPYADAYDWARDAEAGDSGALRDALSVPLADRLFLGGLRNLLAGTAAVAHHGAFHRALSREDFPVRVLSRYSFAASPGLTPELRRTYRTSDRRIPWFIHAGEGTDARSRDELGALEAANVLRQNTVIVHGIAFGAEEAGRIAARGACVVWCPEANRRLYGRTAEVAALRGAGVRVGLGSDSPAAGVRDPLSNLAAARAEGVIDDRELLEMAGRGSAEVARLPTARPPSDGVADLLAVDDVEALLGGDRRTVALVLVAGRPLYGEASLLAGAGKAPLAALHVDGRPKAIEGEIGRRALALRRAHPAVRRVSWLQGVTFEDPAERAAAAR